MKWSWRVGSVAGIGLSIHATVLLDNVGEFVMIQSALGIRGAAAR